MRTTWASWAPDEMQNAAESEALTGFDALGATMRHFIGALPYYGAYTEYEDHVAACGFCQASETSECLAGAALFDVARVGLREQHRLAARN